MHKIRIIGFIFNPLNAETNAICHLLALVGAHHIFHVSGLRAKNKLLWQLEMGEKILQTAVLGYIFIYVQIKY